MNKLAILIPTIVGRDHYIDRLIPIFKSQISAFEDISKCDMLLSQDKDFDSITNSFQSIIGLKYGNIAIFTYKDDSKISTGKKRNALVYSAIEHGFTYGAFFDDDDLPSHDYIEQQLKVVASGADCGSLWGSIYFSGVLGKPFHHSNIYKVWENDTPEYRRCPNHLNCIKLEHFKAVPFPDQVFGEDGKQSEAMAAAEILKTQYNIETVIYHYFTGAKGTATEINYYNSLKQKLGI